VSRIFARIEGRSIKFPNAPWEKGFQMSRDAVEVLRQEFLLARCKILELAATLDRIDRASGSAQDEPQMDLIRAGIDILANGSENRAEAVQRLMSRPYDPSWRTDFSI
jgi:hypothetical protein